MLLLKKLKKLNIQKFNSHDNRELFVFSNF